MSTRIFAKIEGSAARRRVLTTVASRPALDVLRDEWPKEIRLVVRGELWASPRRPQKGSQGYLRGVKA